MPSTTPRREQQSFIEGRIAELEGWLGTAEIIDPGVIDGGGRVVFGATVELVRVSTGAEARYQIVGDMEADIGKGLISISSPLARALIGKEEGETRHRRRARWGDRVRNSFRRVPLTEPNAPSPTRSRRHRTCRPPRGARRHAMLWRVGRDGARAEPGGAGVTTTRSSGRRAGAGCALGLRSSLKPWTIASACFAARGWSSTSARRRADGPRIARRRLRPDGRIVALDLLEMEPLAGVEFIQGDFPPRGCGRPAGGDRRSAGSRPCNVGHGAQSERDEGERSVALARTRGHCRRIPRPACSSTTAAFLVKLFEGEETAPYLRMLRERFENVAIRKPAASGKRSSESYALARDVKRAIS